jgi:hypothetical protein
MADFRPRRLPDPDHLVKKNARRLERLAAEAKKREEAAAKEAKLLQKLKAATNEVTPTVIEQAVLGSSGDPDAAAARRLLPLGIGIDAKTKETKESFCVFLKAILKKAPKIFDEPNVAQKLWWVYAAPMVRDIKDWVPDGRSRGAIYRSLVKHVLVLYPIPNFLYNLFEEPGDHILLFCYIAQGGSVAEAVRSGMIPAPLTKKMCHLFMQATSDYGCVHAIRRAQVLAFGGSQRVVWAFCHSFLRTFQTQGLADNEAFWSTVIQWICANPMLDPTQIGPLLDYIRFKRNENATFSMKGRTPVAMIRDMEIWHGDMAKIKKLNGAVFKPSGFNAGTWTEGSEEKKSLWMITEILSSKELAAEGKKMKHCVYSYARRIEHGDTSIWSLQRTRAVEGTEKYLTIEVQNGSRSIVQARGICNRMPSEVERRFMRQWALENSLTMRA